MQIEVKNLVAGYGGKPAVQLPQLSVAAGEHTLLLGPSGSGKTTLLNVLAALTAPISGSVRIADTELTTLSAAARDRFRGQHIGVVMQRLHLISALSVWDNLAMAQRLNGHAVDAARLTSLLASLGLTAKTHARPDALSQGEAQRVAIARAVVNKPSLVIADEPTSALDDARCHEAMDLLFAQAKAQAATLIVATHDARIRARFSIVVSLA